MKRTCSAVSCKIEIRQEDKYRLWLFGRPCPSCRSNGEPIEMLMYVDANSLVEGIALFQKMLREIGEDPRDGQ